MDKTVDISDKLEQYLLKNAIKESSAAKNLRETTAKHPYAIMMSSPAQVQLITLLVKLINAKRIIEVGVFTGYSTLRMAECIDDDGKILACDITDEYMLAGQPFWEKAGVNNKIKPCIASADKTLQKLLDEGLSGTFDLIYIDADKTGYETYYRLAKPLLRANGLLLLDNMLQGGKVADPGDNTENTVAIRTMNTLISEDPEVDHVLLPISDGLTIAMKKPSP